MPDDIAAALPQRELDIHLGRGLFVEVGAKPARRPPPEPPKPATVAETLRSFELPTTGPRGVTLQALDRSPRDKDLLACAAPGPETTVLAHEAPDGTPMATLSLARLMGLYAASAGAR